MKRAVKILVLLALLPFLTGAGVIVVQRPKVAAAGVTYYGGSNVNSDGTVNGSVSYDFLGAAVAYRNNNTLTSITVNTTGTVKDLKVYCKSRGGTVTIRMAIYDTSLNLLGEGNGSTSFTQTSGGWEGFTTFTGTINLTSGTNYIVAVAADGALFSFGYTETVAGAGYYYKTGDYTGAGMPDPFPTATSDNAQHLIFRIGVE